MNPRGVTLGIGLLTVILGGLAIFAPELVMRRVLGFAVDEHFTQNFVHGEVRAVYGGLFLVIGIYTVLAAMEPALHRGRIVLIGFLWLGLAAGRTSGIVLDGSPGLWGYGALVFEAVVAGLLLAAAQSARPGLGSEAGATVTAPADASSV